MNFKNKNWIIWVLGALFIAPLLAASSSGAVASLSYLGQSGLPRGMRNNNPGNLRIGSSPWKGKIPVAQNQDGAFEQFEAYVWGIRAMILNLRNYFNGGFNTINKIIYKWAPPGDNNNTPAYVATVSNQTGFGPDQVLEFNQDTLKKLVRAMAYVENGRDAVTPDQFNYSWSIL